MSQHHTKAMSRKPAYSPALCQTKSTIASVLYPYVCARMYVTCSSMNKIKRGLGYVKIIYLRCTCGLYCLAKIRDQAASMDESP